MIRFFVLFALILLPSAGQAIDAEVGFSPGSGALELVVKTIDSAHSTLKMAAYTFTSKPISAALVRARRRGVDVRVVVDKSQSSGRYNAATFLANEGIPVRADSMYSIMHDKFIIVDGATVEEGSFNYTAAAVNRNAENVVVLHDAAIAAQYAREWDRLWAESEDIKPKY